jgi:hypothetical protein
MSTTKKPAIPANTLIKTYGGRPVPFQFPGSEEKMYIGSEVNKISKTRPCFVLFHSVKSPVSYKKKEEKEERLPSRSSIVCLHMFLFLFCSSFF